MNLGVDPEIAPTENHRRPTFVCDVFLGARGSYFDLESKLPRVAEEGPRVFPDSAGYKEFVAKRQAAFEAALKSSRTSR